MTRPFRTASLSGSEPPYQRNARPSASQAAHQSPASFRTAGLPESGSPHPTQTSSAGAGSLPPDCPQRRQQPGQNHPSGTAGAAGFPHPGHGGRPPPLRPSGGTGTPPSGAATTPTTPTTPTSPTPPTWRRGSGSWAVAWLA